MKQIWLTMIATLIGFANTNAQLRTVETTTGVAPSNPYIPMYYLNRSIAPYVDNDGYVNPIVALGMLDFGDMLSLPMVLNYSSAIRPPSPELGQGWECPLFDAKVIDVQQNLKKVQLLGGRYIYLTYDPRNESWNHYYTENWKGKALGDNFELIYKPNGCKFIFNKGLISSVTMSSGRTLNWQRSGDRLITLGETGKSPAIKLTYDKLGFVSQILVSPNANGESKKVYSFSPSLIYAGIEKISCPGERSILVQRDHDKALNPTLLVKDSDQAPINLAWDLKTGKISSDDRSTYRIIEANKDMTCPKMYRTSKTSKRTDMYFYDAKHSTTDMSLPDGTLRHVVTIESPGPNYKKVRLIQDTDKKGKTQTVLRCSYDEEGHILLEAIGMKSGKQMTKEFGYDGAGRVTSYAVNGKEVRMNAEDKDDLDKSNSDKSSTDESHSDKSTTGPLK